MSEKIDVNVWTWWVVSVSVSYWTDILNRPAKGTVQVPLFELNSDLLSTWLVGPQGWTQKDKRDTLIKLVQATDLIWNMRPILNGFAQSPIERRSAALRVLSRAKVDRYIHVACEIAPDDHIDIRLMRAAWACSRQALFAIYETPGYLDSVLPGVEVRVHKHIEDAVTTMLDKPPHTFLES